MTKAFRFLPAVVAFCALCSPAAAGDADMLASFAGSWSGKGKFRLTTGSSPVTVSCALDADTSPTSLSLDGKPLTSSDSTILYELRNDLVFYFEFSP